MKYWVYIICVMMGLVACYHHSKHQNDELTCVVTKPEIKDTTIFKEYVAQIRSHQHIEIRTIEEGYLQNIYIDEGQWVKKGQLLFKIMPIIYQAEVQRARAEMEFTEIEYKNTKLLADSNVVSANELALAKAKYDKAKAELELAEAHLNFSEIRAPFDGIVGRFHEVRLGSLLEEGELLTTLSDNSKMWVYFNVPEAEYLNYVYNKSVTKQQVKLKMANGSFFDYMGIVETIGSDFNNETGNIAFRATFPNPDFILRHGQTGKIYFPHRIEKAMIIPQASSFEILDKKYVYVVKNGKIQMCEIKVLTELPHVYIVERGLSAQDTILVEGINKVKNGDKVRTRYRDFSLIMNDLASLHAE